MAPKRAPRTNKTEKQLRLQLIELAANYHSDTTPETVARATAYLDFVKRGPVLPRKPKSRK